MIIVRELDEKLGLTNLAEEYLADTRTGKNIQHELTELLRQSVYSRLAGYEDVTDANQLRGDPALRAVLGRQFCFSRLLPTYKDFSYQAVSWDKPGRIIAKIEWHPNEMFPKIGFIVTSLKWCDKKVLKFYNKRGTCEQWIKEGKYALNWTKLSCQRFVENEIRLKLFIMAYTGAVLLQQNTAQYSWQYSAKAELPDYNLGNFTRTLALPEGIKHWSLRTIQLKLIV